MLNGLIEEEDEDEMLFERVEEEEPSIADLKNEVGRISQADFIERDLFEQENGNNFNMTHNPEPFPNQYDTDVIQGGSASQVVGHLENSQVNIQTAKLKT